MMSTLELSIFKEIDALQNWVNSKKGEGAQIGFVPTMGALHKGHISLIETSLAENDITISSIFVNPTQFTSSSDLKNYPKSIDKDLEMLRKAGCTTVFLPEETTMYPKKPEIKFDFATLDKTMEGEHRPGHFNGVALIVSKLFHIVSPHKAYFGQKDLQQFAIISKLVEDLHFPIKLVRCPIVREDSGLAMSSRNRLLTDEGKEKASALYKGLIYAKNLLEEKGVEEVKQAVVDFLGRQGGVYVEYLEIVETKSLKKIENIEGTNEVAICVAAYIEGIRLIDNLIIN